MKRHLLAVTGALLLAATVVVSGFAVQISGKVQVVAHTVTGEISATNLPGSEGTMTRYATFVRQQCGDGSFRDETTYFDPRAPITRRSVNTTVGIEGRGIFMIQPAKQLLTQIMASVPPMEVNPARLLQMPGVTQEKYLGHDALRYATTSSDGRKTEQWFAPSLGIAVRVHSTQPDGTETDYKVLSVILGEPDREKVIELPKHADGTEWKVSGARKKRLQQFAGESRTDKAVRVQKSLD